MWLFVLARDRGRQRCEVDVYPEGDTELATERLVAQQQVSERPIMVVGAALEDVKQSFPSYFDCLDVKVVEH